MFKSCRCALAAAVVLNGVAINGAAAQDRQAASAGPVAVEHILVTMPLHRESAETALPFTVLSGDDLRRSAAATIGDTLANSPGLANASFGPAVGQPVIRGQQGPRVRVLQNGTSSADAARASQDHANAVEAILADSIEVLRGPSTLLYGGGAIGGVVNVIDSRIPTKLQDENTGVLEYRHNTVSSMDVLVGRADLVAGDFAIHGDALVRDYDDLEIPGEASLLDAEDADHDDDHEDDEHGDDSSRGVLENTAGKASAFTLGSSYHFASGFAGFSVNRLENDYGLPEGAHEHEEDHEGEEHQGEGDEEEEGGIVLSMEQTRYDAVLHLHEVLPGVEIARAFLTHTDYEHAEIEGNGEVGTLYRNDSWQSRIELVHRKLGGFDGVLGLQFTDGEFSAIGEEAFIPVSDYQEFGIFLVEDLHRNDWIYELGLRFDSDERDPITIVGSQRFTSFSGSLSAIWQPAGNWQFGLALSRAERAPSIEELYSNIGNSVDELVLHAATGAYEVGNTELDTEVSRNLDVSVRWNRGDASLALQFYYNDFADFINLENTGRLIGADPLRFYTQQDAKFQGVELEGEVSLGTLGAGQLSLGLTGDFTRGELEGGAEIPRLPPLRLAARLGWDSDRWSLWTRVVDASEQDRPGANETRTPGYTRWDAGIEFRKPVAGSDVDLFLQLRNIGDEDIRLSTSFLRNVAPEGGFGAELGARIYF